MVEFGYLKAEEILRRISSGKRGPLNLRTLLEHLKWPGEIKSLTVDEAQKKLLEQAHYVKSQRKELKNLEPEEIAALSILESKLPMKVKQEVFGHVTSEKDLKPPMARFLEEKGFTPYEEVKIGKSKADIVGWKKRLVFNTLYAIELKTNPEQMRRFLDQITDYAKAADEVFLAATPFAIVQYLNKYGKSWFSADILEEKLEAVGAGLIVADMSLGESQCWLQLNGNNQLAEKEKKSEVVNLLKTLKPFRLR